jgi:hypothetical protein
MAQMAVQTVVDAGTAPTMSAANLTDQAVIGNGHNSFVVVTNGSGASITVTLAVPFAINDNGVAIPAYVVTVPASGTKWIPLRHSYDYQDGTGAHLTYSAVTSVTSALVTVQ